MAELMSYDSGGRQRGKGHAALADLSRTLEALEDRLDRVTKSRSTGGPSSRPLQIQDIVGRTQRRPPQSRSTGRRPELADAVSQIVMRQKLLDEQPGGQFRPMARSSDKGAKAGRPNDNGGVYGADPRGSRNGTTRGEGSVSDLKSELQRLRAELSRNLSSDVSEQVEDMREALADLQSAIAQNARPSIVRAEISRLHHRLDQMGRSGIDGSIVDDMRAQLDDIDNFLARRQGVKEQQRFVGAQGRHQDHSPEADERAELKAEIERLRASLSSLASEDHLRAVEQRWTDFEKRFVEEIGSRDRTTELTDRMMAEMAKLRDQMHDFSSEHSRQAAESVFEGVEARFTTRHETEATIAKIGDRIAQLEESLVALPGTLPFDGLDRRIADLSDFVETLSRQMVSDDRGSERFANIEDRLEEITQAIATLATNPPSIDIAPIERIEARMHALAERVDDIASDGSVSLLTEKLAELTSRFDTMGDSEQNDVLAGQISRLNERLDDLSEQNSLSHKDMAAIESRLASLAERIETQLAQPYEDAETIANLESQVGRLTEFLSSEDFSIPADMERRLGELERKVEENAEQIFFAAKSAADEAVRQMLAQGDFAQSEHVTRLTDELVRLQSLSNDNKVRSTDFYEAVNAALSRLVDRIDAIERDFDHSKSGEKQTASNAADTGYAARATYAPPVTSADASDPAPENDGDGLAEANASGSPSGLRALLSRKFKKRGEEDHRHEAAGTRWSDNDSDEGERPEPAASEPHEHPTLDAADALESQEANRPLAIGSGGPDIAALLERVRNQKAEAKSATTDENAKADFIAAARRAAMAAAEEAEGLNDDPAEDNRMGGMSNAIARRRKPIMLAASAVLLALLALPVGKVIAEKTNLFSSDDVIADVAAPEATGVARNDAPAAAQETAKKAQTAKAESAAPVIGISDKPKQQIANSQPAEQKPLADVAQSTSAVSPASFKPNAEIAQVGPTIAASNAADYGDQVASLPEGIGSQPLLDAATSGDAKALFELGLRLMEGRVVSSNPTKAAEWFERSAELDFAPAQYSLGTLYEKGNGVKRDTIKARDWYLKAAENGNVRAMHNLAVLFATGVDGKSEPKLAADWFIEAANHGMTDSQYNLGILYARGAGVDPDLTESYKWFSIVGESGDKDAQEKRDEVAKSLSPEELTEAKAAVANFKVKNRSEIANTVDIPKDWAAAAPKPTKTASIDMNRAIRNIQAILGKLGYDAGPPDGLIGDRTTSAIMDFQKDAGLAATGEIDEALIRALLDRKDG
ncbi:peptidoglycan-binding protein [Fulvimarina sp. MAC3]|uniref:peptidoglycan-binding protein n=1 Tax=Fulvimarina sp. MAC3 TaxID=3148887 RepID=UPI0031FBF6F6